MLERILHYHWKGSEQTKLDYELLIQDCTECFIVTAAVTSGGKCLLGRGESNCKGPEAQGNCEFDLLEEEQRAGGGSSQLE